MPSRGVQVHCSSTSSASSKPSSSMQQRSSRHILVLTSTSFASPTTRKHERSSSLAPLPSTPNGSPVPLIPKWPTSSPFTRVAHQFPSPPAGSPVPLSLEWLASTPPTQMARVHFTQGASNTLHRNAAGGFSGASRIYASVVITFSSHLSRRAPPFSPLLRKQVTNIRLALPCSLTLSTSSS